MIKMFALVGLDGEVFLTHEDRAQLQEYNDRNGFGMYNIVEMNYNDDPMTERGEKLSARIEETFGKDLIKNLHLNKGVKFYEMHIDDRLQMISVIIHQEGAFSLENTEPFKFNDSHKLT